MRILGIDPGLERVGFGFIERDTSDRYHAKNWGVITTSKKDPEAKRLSVIQSELFALVDTLKPDVAAVEKIFFFRNAKTMVPVCQARGVILLVLHQTSTSYREYTPMQVKLNMTGYGNASKRDVQDMVQRIFDLESRPKSDDAADALAIALSCAFEEGPIQLSGGSGGSATGFLQG